MNSTSTSNLNELYKKLDSEQRKHTMSYKIAVVLALSFLLVTLHLSLEMSKKAKLVQQQIDYYERSTQAQRRLIDEQSSTISSYLSRIEHLEEVISLKDATIKEQSGVIYDLKLNIRDLTRIIDSREGVDINNRFTGSLQGTSPARSQPGTARSAGPSVCR